MENIRLDDFTLYKFLSGIRYSPDGKNACFIVHRMNYEDNAYDSNLWIYDLDGDRYYRLTASDRGTRFIWLDNENILFSGDRDPKDRSKKDAGEEFTVFYSINIHGGEAQEAFRIQRDVNSIKKIDADTFIFTSTYNPNRPDIVYTDEESKKMMLRKKKEDSDYEVLEEIPYWSNGGGFTSKNRDRLYIYHRDTNAYEALSDESINVEAFNLSSDNKVVFMGWQYEGKMDIKNALYTIDLGDRKVRRITGDEEFVYVYANFMDENTIICSGTDMKSYGVNENTKFYIIDLKDLKRKCITPEFDTSIWNSVGSDCRYGGSEDMMVRGGCLYFITTENDSSYVNRIDREGHIEKVITGKGSVDGYDIYHGNVLFIALRDYKLQEIYKLGENEKQLTHFNDWVHSEREISRPEKLSFESEEGVTIEGWVIKPVHYDEKKRYPGILDIHGGPKTVFGEVYIHEMQYWAAQGYFVFFCNPRGSDGRGNEFADIRGKYGTVDYDDLMRFTDAVLNRYASIDPDRLGVTGGSYGGFMTNWIIGHTVRFKAAASQRSISNWVSKFCTTDIGYYFVDDQAGGTPWNNQEKLWQQSPLKYADRVKTPTLFLHSEEDYRCWLAEGLQMFTALKYHGVEARLCMFRGENHELSRSGKPRHRERRLSEITEWFNNHLK